MIKIAIVSFSHIAVAKIILFKRYVANFKKEKSIKNRRLFYLFFDVSNVIFVTVFVEEKENILSKIYQNLTDNLHFFGDFIHSLVV